MDSDAVHKMGEDLLSSIFKIAIIIFITGILIGGIGAYGVAKKIEDNKAREKQQFQQNK